MKQPSRPPRTPSSLSDSVHHRLNMYALMASAAGVGALSSTQPSEAKIVYTPAHHVIGEYQEYHLAMSHQTTDFIIPNLKCPTNGSGCTSAAFARLYVEPASLGSPNGVIGSRSGGSRVWVAALKRGELISKKQTFFRRGSMAVEWYTCCTIHPSGTSGPWVNVSDRYLGLKFKIKEEFHYGWARLNVTVPKQQFVIHVTLTGYAYETVPNKPIIAGKTDGPDAVTVEPDTEAGTLGHLAVGRR